MFRDARLFNQPLGSWNVSKVETIEDMFAGADAFNQDLGAWQLTSLKKNESKRGKSK